MTNRVCAEVTVFDHHPVIRNYTFSQLTDYAFGLLSAVYGTIVALCYQV